MSRIAKIILTVIVLSGILWRFPLIHIVTIAQSEKEKSAAAFDPAQFAEKFWSERLPGAFSNAVDAQVLVAAIHVDAVGARKKFSRNAGLGESYSYFITGRGRVLATNEDEILLAVTPGSTNAEVSLQAGPLFNNVVRDGTGLLDLNDFPNSQDFNSIAAALNHIVETRIQPELRQQAKIGNTIFFTGCAEVADESTDLTPLKVVPLKTASP